MNEATPIRHAVDLNQIEDRIREPMKNAPPQPWTLANLADDVAGGIAKLLAAMDGGDKALDEIVRAATAILEKEKHARTVLAAVRASAQK